MCYQATASDLPFYDIIAPQKLPLSKIFDDVIACDLCFGPSQSKILATPMSGATGSNKFSGKTALRFN